MKQVRPVLIVTLAALLSFGTVIFVSCKKDKVCSDIKCLHGGVCSDDNCTCKTGYEGVLCESAINTGFAGTYTGIDCNGAETYIITASGADPLKISVPVYIPSCSSIVTLQGTLSAAAPYTTASFPEQNVTNSCGTYIVSGSATIDKNNQDNITINLTIVSNGATTSCTFSGSK